MSPFLPGSRPVTEAMHQILVIEDEPHIRHVLKVVGTRYVLGKGPLLGPSPAIGPDQSLRDGRRSFLDF